MERSESDEQVPYSCGAEEKDYDLGHLPPLLEDEVSGGGFVETGWEGKGRVSPIGSHYYIISHWGCRLTFLVATSWFERVGVGEVS